MPELVGLLRKLVGLLEAPPETKLPEPHEGMTPEEKAPELFMLLPVLAERVAAAAQQGG